MNTDNEPFFKEQDMGRNSFMEPEITEMMSGWEVDTSNGTFFIPGDVFPVGPDVPLSEFDEYVEGEVYSADIVTGFFGRYSAAGYMDCTDWTFGDDRDILESDLREMYDTEDDSDDEDSEDDDN